VNVNGHDLAYFLMNRGLLTKATHDTTIRLAPALIITEDQIKRASQLVKLAVRDLNKLSRDRKAEAKGLAQPQKTEDQQTNQVKKTKTETNNTGA